MTKKECEKELRCYPAALTAAEAAQILRVSIKTVYKLIHEKTLPAVKVGRENRIAKSPVSYTHLVWRSFCWYRDPREMSKSTINPPTGTDCLRRCAGFP